MSFRRDDEKLFEKYKAIWTKIEELKRYRVFNFTSLWWWWWWWWYIYIYTYIYITTKIRTYGDNIYTNFGGLDVPEDDIECESFMFISIDSLLVLENKYYL